MLACLEYFFLLLIIILVAIVLANNVAIIYSIIKTRSNILIFNSCLVNYKSTIQINILELLNNIKF